MAREYRGASEFRITLTAVADPLSPSDPAAARYRWSGLAHTGAEDSLQCCGGGNQTHEGPDAQKRAGWVSCEGGRLMLKTKAPRSRLSKSTLERWDGVGDDVDPDAQSGGGTN